MVCGAESCAAQPPGFPVRAREIVSKRKEEDLEFEVRGEELLLDQSCRPD